jgi:glycosyltransferase involved in cell wall biosynthesis
VTVTPAETPAEAPPGTGLRVLVLDRGISNPYSRGLVGGLRDNGVRVALAGAAVSGFEGVLPVFARSGVAGQKVRKLLDALLGIPVMAVSLVQLRPQVLHFQWGTIHSYALARVLRLLTGAPIVLTIHNPEARDSGYRWQPPMIAIADELICHGEALRDMLVRDYPEVESHVTVIAHGNYAHAIERFDRREARARLDLPAEDPVYTFFGQLSERKGIGTLLRAFRLHCDAGLPGTLVLAGTVIDLDLDELKALLGPHQARARWITSVEALPAEQLDLVISAATQVVLPFDHATQSGSAVYAMTHCRCVVSTFAGELPGLLEGRGLLVAPRDAEALAGTLAIAVDDPERIDELAERACQHVETALDWRALAAETLEVYERARAGVRDSSRLRRARAAAR